MRNKLKIAMICADYPPKSGPGPTRMSAFVKGLSENGFEPQVFTSKREAGKLSATWYQLVESDCCTDELVGAKTGRGRTQPFIEKLINFFVPMEPVVTLSLFNLRRVFKEYAEREKPDLIFTTSNPLASSVGGWLLKKRYQIPLVVEFRDPWTQNPIRNWPTYLHYFIEVYLEQKVLRAADSIIMNTPTARLNLLSKYKWLDENSVHVISHGYDGDFVKYQPSLRTVEGDGSIKKIKIGYAGGFYMGSGSRNRSSKLRRMVKKLKSVISHNVVSSSLTERGSSPKQMLDAIYKYNSNGKKDNVRIEMDFIGSAEKPLKRYIAEKGLSEFVRVLPRVNQSQIRDVLQSYDLLYLTNPQIEQSPFISTKTFDYLAANRPIISSLPVSDQAMVVSLAQNNWQGGTINSSSSLFDALKNATQNNHHRLSVFQPNLKVVELFSRKHQLKDLIQVFKQTVGVLTVSPVISEGFVKLGQVHSGISVESS